MSPTFTSTERCSQTAKLQRGRPCSPSDVTMTYFDSFIYSFKAKLWTLTKQNRVLLLFKCLKRCLESWRKTSLSSSSAVWEQTGWPMTSDLECRCWSEMCFVLTSSTKASGDKTDVSTGRRSALQPAAGGEDLNWDQWSSASVCLKSWNKLRLVFCQY